MGLTMFWKFSAKPNWHLDAYRLNVVGNLFSDKWYQNPSHTSVDPTLTEHSSLNWLDGLTLPPWQKWIARRRGWSDMFVQREILPLVNFCLHRGYVFSPSFPNKFKSSMLFSPYSYHIEQCYSGAVKNSFSLNCSIFWIHKCTYPFSFLWHDW